MKKRWKSILLGAVIILVVSVCGCSKTSEDKVRIEKNEETVHLTFFTSAGSNEWEDAYKNLLLEYNQKHKNTEVGYEAVSVADGYNEFLLERLDAGQGDDVFETNADVVKTLFLRGDFYDLSELPAFSELNDAAKEQSVINGLAYSVPLQMTAYGMAVNIDLLSEYGLETPVNYEQWMNCNEVLKENGITPISVNRWYALTVPVMARGLAEIYRSENKDDIIQGLNTGEIKIGDYMLPGFQMFEQFVKKGYYGNNLSSDDVDSIRAATTDYDDFINGKTAFLISTIASEGPLAERGKNLNYIHQGVPALSDGCISIPSVASRMSVNANGKHINETLDFMEYITSEKVKKILTGGETGLPTLKNSDFKIQDEKLIKLCETAMQPGQVPIEDMDLHFTYWDVTRELCISMFDGMTAEEAAEEYNKIQMEQIKEYKARMENK